MKIAPNLSLPDEFITWKMGLLGRTGSGKTNSAIVLAEYMAAHGLPYVIFDPQGDWWGIGSKYPIAILGGDHAHVPLEPTGGKLAADFVISERIPVLLDLFNMGEGEMVRFATDFAKRLWARNRDALHVFLDEADLFAPQKAVTKEKAFCLGAWQNVVRRGRSRGIGVTMITQRSAVINKDLLTQADPLIVHRLTAPQDLAAIDFYLSYHGHSREKIKSITAQIAKLKIGEAFVISPGTLEIEPRKIQVYKRKSFDSSATPKPGQKRREPRAMADVDLGALQTAMADTIERAKADDPKELRKTINELNRQLKSSKPVVDQQAIDRAVAKVAADRDGYWGLQVDECNRRLFTLGKRISDIGALCELNGQAELVKVEPPALPQIASSGSPPKAVPVTPKPRMSADLSARPDSGELTPYQSDLQRVLIDRHPIQTPKAMLATLAKKSARSSVFMPNLNTLIGLAYAVRSDGNYVATESGLHALPGYEPAPPSGTAALNHWLQALPAYESSLLAVLAEDWPESLTYAEIAEASGKSQGSSMFRPAIRNLVKSAFAVETVGGCFIAADVFFEGVVS